MMDADEGSTSPSPGSWRDQFHLWEFEDPVFRFSFGFQERLVSGKQPPGDRQRTPS